MNATALTLSLLLSSPICYHPPIFYPGGSDAVCTDEGAMRVGKALAVSAGLAGVAAGMAYKMPPGRVTRGGVGPAFQEEVQQIPRRPTHQYERRSSATPQDAQGWSRRAGVYLERAEKTGDPRDLLQAYEAAVRALEEDSRLPEALYRKAGALEGLFLRDAARSVWRELEQTPSWAAEASRRLKALDQSRTVGGTPSEQEAALRAAALQKDTDQVMTIVGRDRKWAREYAEQQLLGDWGEAWLKAQTQSAEEHLGVLQAVGYALARTNGERLVQDSVDRINELLRNGDVQRLSELAWGAREFRDGYMLYSMRRSSSAVPQLTTAYEALSQADCALAWRAAFYLASADYISRKYPEALAGTERLAQQIKDKNLPYGALQAHVYWIKGMAEATLGKTKEAVKDLENAFDGFNRLGEGENAASIDCRLGEVLMSRGRRSEAWEFIYRALRSTPTLRDPNQVGAVYMIAGNAALQEGFDDAALIFQEERVRQSRLNKDNLLAQVEALTWLARFQHHQGDDAGAQDSLQKARRLINNKKMDPKQRPRRLADLAMIQGMILEEEDPEKASEFLSSALPTYQNEKNAIFSLWTFLARGRAYRQSGRDDAAEKDFEEAMKLYGDMGETLEAEDLRLALLEETDSVFDEMVSLQDVRGNWERALAYADRARTRVLPGSASKLWTGLENETTLLLASEPQPLSLDEIRRRLPEGVTLVQFSVLQDRILIWTLRRSGEGERPLSQKIQREDLEDLVAWFRATDSKDWESASEELFDLLIKPWLSTVSAEEKIVFIPDKVLHWVTFSALKDRRSGDFLIETHPLVIAPSATLYVNALERQNVRQPRGSHGLVVGEPAIDHRVPGNETLASLPAAKDEAQRLARLTKARLLEGEDADKATFLEAAREAEWIQFSGHAVIDPANTLLSKLVLASGKNGDSRDNGALTAQEIYSQKLKATQLVVLAACDTGNEYVPGGEGVTSLARAFLAAGVPTVVASLWSVDDEATARLFEYFHDNYQKNGDPVIALRDAQLKMLRSSNKRENSPSSWAAFEVIGASADDQP
jgi:CHAT domain-containing protein/tetratricopeptide (TPR) repeat protein